MHTSHRPSGPTARAAIRHAAHGALLTLLLWAPALSQALPPIAQTAAVSDPRFGLTLLPEGIIKKHDKRDTLLWAPALSQTLPPIAHTADLSGPRFGLTLLSDGIVKKLDDRNINVGPHISQFGWQFEKQFYTRDSGVTMVTEWIALVGGLEQSAALPSLSWMVGVRTRDGAEFGIGPNVTPAGTSLVLATGMTFRAGAFNIPVNVAVVPSKAGTRVTLLSGFSLRQR
jgi:hypothetical protein